MTQNYTLIKNFVSKESLENVIAGTKRVVKRFYDEHHIANHSAYFSDVSANRESYAFAVKNTDEYSPIPFIQTSTIAETSRQISLLNHKIPEFLGIKQDSRMLFNIQFYKGYNKPVAKHFDGELQKFTVNEDGSLNIQDAIRPQHVAVLTLINDVPGGAGTRIHFKDGTSQVIKAEAGDLLVFNNVECEHSVDSLEGEATRSDGLLRMTIGWRSLDSECVLWKDGQYAKHLTKEEADYIQRSWLHEVWPDMYKNYLESKQKVAF